MSHSPYPVVSVAPMLDYTDKHYLHFVRTFAPNFLLYTEMITAAAILHSGAGRQLGFNPNLNPVICQLGGSNPNDLAEAAKHVAAQGYAGINLNIGCPSDRVQSGRFGACLMAEPELVSDCIQAIQTVIPSTMTVSVKTRVGIDNQDSYEFLTRFITKVAEAGCNEFIIHARKAWLKGLSPKQNRTIPPLDYQRVYQLKQDFPDLTIGINGGVESLEAVETHLQAVDHVMIGRAAYASPSFLMAIESKLFNQKTTSFNDIIRKYCNYSLTEAEQGASFKWLARHLVPLFSGRPGAKRWRQCIANELARVKDSHQAVAILYEKSSELMES